MGTKNNYYLYYLSNLNLIKKNLIQNV